MAAELVDSLWRERVARGDRGRLIDLSEVCCPMSRPPAARFRAVSAA